MKFIYLTIFMSAFLFLSCGRKIDNKVITYERSIINGSTKINDQVKSTLSLNWGFCTGVAISRKHILLAAHCLINDEEGSLNYTYGLRTGDLMVTYDYRKREHYYIIKKTTIYESYLNKAKEIYARSQSLDGMIGSALDLAIIEVETSLNNVEIAEIDFEYNLKSTDRHAIVTGAGRDSFQEEVQEELEFRDISSGKITLLSHEEINGFYQCDNKFYYCSYGTHHLPDTAVTSHGDSGGGVFVNNKLVAINSFAFWTSFKSKTLIHGHSKLNLAKEFIINTIKN